MLLVSKLRRSESWPEMIRCVALWLLCAALVINPGLVRGQARPTATINIPVDLAGADLSSNLFGIFFEEINFAGEGGLYAELVRNRSVANSANPDFWTLVTQGSASGQISVDPGQPLNTNILHSLKLTMQSGIGSVGAGNSGFWGMALQTGATYNLSFYAKAVPGLTGPVGVRLESADGSQLTPRTRLPA